MSKQTKFTPGPWEAVIYGGWDTPRVWSGDGSIAMLQHHDAGPHEAEANTRLIAAAPDMYEALERVLHLLTVTSKTTCMCGNPMSATNHDSHEAVSAFEFFSTGDIECIQAALRKARGEAPNA